MRINSNFSFNSNSKTKGKGAKARNGVLKVCLLSLALSCASCISGAVPAEEYFTIGMAYFELGKYTEAERWLRRASATDRTMTATEYNLGRIAFETSRYSEAVRYFDLVLTKDPQNVMALKAAAYTRIRMGNIEEAESLYRRVLELVPENADEGYNFALVLFAIEKYEECEEVLLRYPFALDERPDSLLLLARAQDAQNKVEAIDTFARWIAGSTAPNPKVLHEYGKALERAELYAKALEQYQASLAALKEDLANLKKSTLRFDIGRLLLIADPENPEGITELEAAAKEGFNDKEAIEALLSDTRIKEAVLGDIKKIFESILNASPASSEEDTPKEDS